MKPATNTPTFRVLLSISVVWALVVGVLNYAQYNSITLTNGILTNDHDVSNCYSPPGFGINTKDYTATCLSIENEQLLHDAEQEQKNLDQARWEAAISGILRTFFPPITILLIAAYWLAIAKGAAALGQGGKSISSAYIRWVRGKEDSPR